MSTATEQLTALRERIIARFNLEELRLLVFDLGENYDDLRGETISGKVQAFLEHLDKRGRLPHLIDQLQRLRPIEAWRNILPAEPEARSPYKGLQFFDEADAPLFFGRDQVTADLVDHLRRRRFLAVVGASGSGKSSIVRAGVVTAVRGGAIVMDNGRSSANWSIHVITPGGEPLKALAASLTRDSESVTAAKTLLDDLRAGADSLDLFLYRQIGDNGRLLLIVDQFEELFTQCHDPAARQLFVENLVTAVGGVQQRFRLILALRADFYAFAVQYESLRPLLETRQKIVGAMKAEELRQAIEGPATKGNWTLQPGLVETMLQDVGREPGALPLLSHALQETWARREGRTLTLAGYQAAGGVRKAIAQTADAVYASLTPAQQTIARNIFLRLTELGEGTEDTRRRALLSELLPEGVEETAVGEVLDLLARKRLVTLNEETAQPQAEVAHEALIREWPALRAWLDENREGLRIHRQLTEAAQAWRASGEDASYLYRGGRLAQAWEWAAQPGAQLNSLEQQFVAASQTAETQEAAEREAQRQRELEQAQQLAAEAEARRRAEAERANIQARTTQRIRRFAVGLIVVTFTAIGAAIFGFIQRDIAIERANTAQSQALAVASLTIQQKDPMRALLLGIAAGQTTDTPLAFEALRSVLPRIALRLYPLQHDYYSMNSPVWNEKGSQVLSWSGNIAQVWEATTGAERARFEHESLVNGAAWSADGNQVITWSSDDRVWVWDVATGAEQARFQHEGSVNGAAWSEDGSQVLTWSSDGMARVWDAIKGIERIRFTHEFGSNVNGAAWDGNGSRVLTWSDDGTARVWEVTTGAQQACFEHERVVYGAMWGRDESLVLTWSAEETARVWDVVTGKERASFSHERWVNGVAWNSAGSQVLTWGNDDTVRVWDVATGVEQARFSHESRVLVAAWNGSGNQVLTISDDAAVRVWETATGKEQALFSHESFVNGATWNSMGNQVLTWSDDGTARVWEVASGAEQLRLTHGSWVLGAAWNKNENLLLTFSKDGTAWIWGATRGTELTNFTHENRVLGAVWNGNESQVLTWGCDMAEKNDSCLQGTARVWSVETGLELVRFMHGSSVNGAVWNRAESQVLTQSDDRTVRVWDIMTGTELTRFTHDSWVGGAIWNGDESLVLTWSDDGAVRVWETASGAEQLRLTHDSEVYGATWNKDESLILTWSNDGKVRMWEAVSSAERLQLAHDAWAHGATWNGDESLILTWSGDGTARVWQAASGAERLRLSHEGWVEGATWNGDESLILTWSGDGTVRVWRIASGAEQLRLIHEDPVHGAAWNEDESLILTWGLDGTAWVWEAATGAVVFTLTGDGSPAVTAQWRQDGRRILFVTRGGFAGIFYTQMADLLNAACQRTTRNLTWQEWQLYFPGQPYRVICP